MQSNGPRRGWSPIRVAILVTLAVMLAAAIVAVMVQTRG